VRGLFSMRVGSGIHELCRKRVCWKGPQCHQYSCRRAGRRDHHDVIDSDAAAMADRPHE
jgi:hypothetical protein